MPDLVTFDCFAGIGGFTLGFESEGFKTVGVCEKDKYCQLLYKAYYGTKGKILYDDATTIDPDAMPDFDIFTGGFPCQPFSIAGKRQGFKDIRGTMFFEVIRICQVKKPKYIILENPKGLLSHDNGRTFATMLKILSNIGYSVEWQVLNSTVFGVPQNRDRIFIIGYFGRKCARKIFPIQQNEIISFDSSRSTKEKGQGYMLIISIILLPKDY